MYEGYLSLWENALPQDKLPVYPSYDLLEAKGGEQTFFAKETLRISDTRSRVIVDQRPAEPGELLRDPTLKFIPDWRANLLYRMDIINRAKNDLMYQQYMMNACRSSILFFANTFFK